MRRFLLLVGLPLLFAGCIRDNASHCGNQAGNSSCADRNAETPFCDICTPSNDGCVAEAPRAACVFGAAGSESNAAGTASAGSGTTQGPGTSMGPGMTEGATTAESMTSNPMPETSTTGEDGETTGVPPLLCGNGEVDEFEECDGDVVEGDDCASEGLGRGELSCTENCVFNTTECTAPPQCGNGEVESGELCEPEDQKFMLSCDSLDPQFVDGDVRCNRGCTYDTSECVQCTPPGALEGCTRGAGECCEGATCECALTGGLCGCVAS